jgi:histone deacetylase 1/2
MVNQHGMTTRPKKGLRFPTFYVATPISLILKTHQAALADPNWRATMEDEFRALQLNNTWDLITRPPGTNIVTGKWIFTHKFNTDDTLERYKAHLVVRGFTQSPSIDFDETFSPVVKPTTVHIVLSLAMSHKWLVH